MVRLLAYNTLLFLAPFAVYAGWLLATKRSLGSIGNWSTKIIIILSSLGAVAAIIGLVVLTSNAGTSTNEQYHPAEIIDGELVPGRFGDE